MSDYTKATDFAAKDALASGNPAKVVSGTEIDNEFEALETAVNSKANLASPALTGTPTHGGVEVGYRSVPLTATTGTTASTSARGGGYSATGNMTIPASVFAAGDAFVIYCNQASSITITQGGGLTQRQAGTANTGNRTLAGYGLATILFISATECVITGPGVS